MYCNATVDMARDRIKRNYLPMFLQSGFSEIFQSSDVGNTRKRGITKNELEWVGGGYLVPKGAQTAKHMRDIAVLLMLMDELDEGGKPRPRRRGADQTIDLPGQRTILFPDDAQEVIVVRAVPRQIEEIKRMLEFIDVDLGVEVDPVLIPIEYIPVGELVTIIRPLVAAGEVTSRPDTSKAGGQRRPKSRRPSRVRGQSSRSSSAATIWPMISAAERLRTSAWVPVWQKRQVSVQPTWLETQSVPRSSSGMNTVSTSWPSARRSSHLRVPSAETWALTASGRSSV